jgi:hypothetical protein
MNIAMLEVPACGQSNPEIGQVVRLPSIHLRNSGVRLMIEL